MSGISDVGKKLSSLAGNASKKSGSLMKAAKLSSEISKLQMDIEDVQFELGRAYYENNKDASPGPYADYVQRIKSCEASIKECEDQLLIIKGMRSCKDCGAVVEKFDEFCPKCGAKMPLSEEKREKIICKNCGNECSCDHECCGTCGFFLK